MSDVAAALLSALGMGPKKPQKPVLTPSEEAAPWMVPQGGAGGPVAQGGSMEEGVPEPPPGRLDELDALINEIKKQKQRAAILGGSPAPQ